MLKALTAFGVTLTFVVAALAQKLPNIQETGVRSPVNVKVDGKATEWNNSYQSYNKANMIYYTLANDDENLYLVVSSSNNGMSSKILYSGLTIEFFDGKKKEDVKSVTFPTPQRDSWITFRNMATPLVHLPSVTYITDKQIDSTRQALNKKRIDNLKYVIVKGIQQMPDTLLSVYNAEGIKVQALFDSQETLVYELKVPLEYLNLSLKGQKEISYQLTLKGTLSSRTVPIGMMRAYTLGGIPLIGLIEDSKFGGSYKLAKNP